jgi:hypothetical protein
VPFGWFGDIPPVGEHNSELNLYIYISFVGGPLTNHWQLFAILQSLFFLNSRAKPFLQMIFSLNIFFDWSCSVYDKFNNVVVKNKTNYNFLTVFFYAPGVSFYAEGLEY